MRLLALAILWRNMHSTKLHEGRCGAVAFNLFGARLPRPANGSYAVLLEILVGLRKMLAAQETAIG